MTVSVVQDPATKALAVRNQVRVLNRQRSLSAHSVWITQTKYSALADEYCLLVLSTMEGNRLCPWASVTLRPGIGFRQCFHSLAAKHPKALRDSRELKLYHLSPGWNDSESLRGLSRGQRAATEPGRLPSPEHLAAEKGVDAHPPKYQSCRSDADLQNRRLRRTLP